MIEFDPRRHVWAQVSEDIETRIKDGRISPTQRLTEWGIADEYEIARGTVRRVFQDLRERGVIVTLAGKGSYPAPPPPEGGDILD